MEISSKRNAPTNFIDTDEAMVQNKVSIKKEVENYECENIEMIQNNSDVDEMNEIDIKTDPIEHSNEDLEMQMSKCHICDMKYKNWNSHFFKFHSQSEVKTENYKLKHCFVKIEPLIEIKNTVQVIHVNIPEELFPNYELLDIQGLPDKIQQEENIFKD